MFNSISTIVQPSEEPITVSYVLKHTQLDDSNLELSPIFPAVSIVSSAGNIGNGVYRYAVTFVTADGETDLGDQSDSIEVVDNAVAGQVLVDCIQTGGALVVARKIYRTTAGGNAFYLLATINDNSTEQYTDNKSDAELGVGAPSINTTSDPLLNIFIKSAREMAEHRLGRKLITQTVIANYDSFPEYFELPPLQSVSAIRYYDTNGVLTVIDPANYIVDNLCKPAEIHPAYGYSFPVAQSRRNAVQVEFVAGYGDANSVPKCIIQWMLFAINTAWNTRHQFDLSTGRAALTEVPRAEYIDRALDPETVYYTGV